MVDRLKSALLNFVRRALLNYSCVVLYCIQFTPCNGTKIYPLANYEMIQALQPKHWNKDFSGQPITNEVGQAVHPFSPALEVELRFLRSANHQQQGSRN